MAKVIRGVKNVTKGYSSVQVKVRNGKVPEHVRTWIILTSDSATSNDAWGPTGTEMSDIAAMTFNGYEIGVVRVPDPGKATKSNELQLNRFL